MKTNALLILVVIIIVCALGCNESTSDSLHLNKRNVNVYIDDSILQLNIPTTLLDSNCLNKTRLGVKRRTILLGSCGNFYVSKKASYSSINITYECYFDGDSLTETMFNSVLKNQISYINQNADEIFISLDTMKVFGQSIAILKKVEGCGDSALYTTVCFIPSPLKTKIYRVYISCDKSEVGNRLRDSIPLIINSIYTAPRSPLVSISK